MQRLRQWLSQSTQKVRAGPTEPLRIVMGNTSCDVDSAVGAVGLAYYYQTKLNQQWTPIINCKRADFFCNLEIVKHFENCQISQDDLYFYDEFKAQFPTAEGVEEMALIDHNILDLEQNNLAGKVTRVIDHHIDSGAYADQLVEKTCHLVGSACTLLVLMVKQDEALFAEDLVRSEPGQLPNLSYFLGAAVVLDSYFFKEELRAKKWTDEDTVAHEYLMQYADVGQEYWAALNHAKFDVQAGLTLGMKGIMIRDYKQYDLQSGVMGVSVCTGTIDTLLNHFGMDTFGAEVKKYVLEKNLGLMVFIAIQAEDDGSIQKNILIFECDQNPTEHALKNKASNLRQLIEGTEDMQLQNKRELTMEQLGGAGVATYYTIGNNRYSRKAYEAIVKADQSWQN